MKKQIIPILGIAALSVIGCTKSTGPVPQLREIAVSTNVTLTKGVDVTDASIATAPLRVAMEGLEDPTDQSGLAKMTTLEIADFTKEGSVFTCATKKYFFPVDDSNVKFYAYAPASAGFTESTTAPLEGTGFAVKPNVKDQVDLVVAYGEGNQQDKEPVALALMHQLSKVDISAMSGAESGYNYEIKGVKLENIDMAASKIAFPTAVKSFATLTLSGSKSSCEAVFDTPVTLGSKWVNLFGEGQSAYILPQAVGQWDHLNDKSNQAQSFIVEILVKISTKAGELIYPKNGNDYDYIAVGLTDAANIAAFSEGTHYNFTLDFTSGAGWVYPGYTPGANDENVPGKPVFRTLANFKVSVEPWIEHGDTPLYL